MMLVRRSLVQTYISFHHVVGVGGDVPGQAKITDLRQPSFSQEDISGSEVSVNTLTDRHGIKPRPVKASFIGADV